MKPIVPLVACVLFLTACRSTIHNPNKLSYGMSKAEALAVMGQPETTVSPGNGVEILRYYLKKQRPPLKWPIVTEYLVRLTDGHVQAYGTPKDLNTYLDPRHRTVNLNIHTDTNTAPVQPSVQINAN